MSNPWLWSLVFAVFLPAVIALVALRSLWPHRLARQITLFSGGMFAGLALFVILPDVYEDGGWRASMACMAAGFVAIGLVDRFVEPVCPDCHGSTRRHSVWPLLGALGAHAMIDGALIQLAGPTSLTGWAIFFHRIPEAVGTAVLLRAAIRSSRAAAAGLMLLQVLTLAGLWWASLLNLDWLHRGYAFAGGSLLYLGFHRVHQSWHAADARLAYTLTGAFGVFAIRQCFRLLVP